MKKELICGLSAALLLACPTACGDSQADQPSEPDHTPAAVQMEKQITKRGSNPMKKRFLSFALALALTLSLLPMSAAAASSKPVKIGNITLSDVLTTNEYETAKEVLPGGDTTAEYEFLYNLGDVGFWYSDVKEYGYSTFWCYLLPKDATISIQLTQEIPECYVYMYTLKESKTMLGSQCWLTTFITGLKYEPDYGKSEANILISKGYIEGGLASMNLDPKFDLLRIVAGDEEILVWYGGPSTSAPSFTDVPDDQYYSAPVSWAVEKGITNGTEPGKFSPGQNCTQAQILTFLYRAVRGVGAASAEDMNNAISWAREKGMIGTSFDGSKPCTRSTAVNYIWQAFNKPTAKASNFKDVDAKADYAKAVSWAVEKEITNGTNPEGTMFSPDDICTRGHIMTFLYRAYNN